ncbi:MAG TPA: glycosyltransferase [Elusimicrobiales bacterium]|nr:glycosyltransferase [Elusimicrobiales bacterium]
MQRILLVNFAECPENLHLEQAFIAAAARSRGVRLDVLHDQDFHYSFIPQPANRRGFRRRFQGDAASKPLLRARFDALIALDFPKRRRCAPFFCRLFAEGAAKRKYFLANHLVPSPGHNFTADLFRRAKLLSRAAATWILEYDDPPLWGELGAAPEAVVRRPYCVDTGYYTPAPRPPRGGYIFSGGSAGREFAALSAAAASCGLPLKVRSDMPAPAGSALSGAAWEPFSPNLNTLVETLRGCALAVLPVSDGFINEAAGNSIAFMAMSCGRPVLVRDTPYMRRYINDGVNGFLYGRLEEGVLAADIGRIMALSPARLRALCRRARETMLKRASLSALAASVLSAVKWKAPRSASAGF